MEMEPCLVHDWLTGMRGGEKCLAPLCRAFPRAPLLTLVHRRGATAPESERMDIRTSFLARLPGASRHYRALLPLMPSAIERLRVPDTCSLILSFSHAVAKSVLPPPGTPHICYCFTPMRYAWHLRDDYLPRVRHGNPLRRFVGHALLDRLRRWDRHTAARVTQFVAVSQTVRRRIGEAYGRDSQVIYPPVDTEFYTPDDGPREDYYLCVSALAPYKRIDLAVEACGQLGRKLVVIGSGPERRRLERRARGAATFLGWTSDEEIRRHLRRCRALLFPGHEDFGIVPVEAMACGAPVVAYRAGGAVESLVPTTDLKPGTGVFFDHQTPNSLADAMLWLEKHTDAVCPATARRQAEQFESKRYLRQMLDFLRCASADGPTGEPRGAATRVPSRAAKGGLSAL